LIKQEKPIKIFTHSLNDPLPDHHAVAKIITDMLPKITCPVYTYEVWTLFRFRQRNLPKLIEVLRRVVKEHDERKGELLDAGQALFYGKGYDRTSVAEIIETVEKVKNIAGLKNTATNILAFSVIL